MRTWLFVACAVSACSSPTAVAPIHPAGGHLVDADGRNVVLRGINARAAGFFDERSAHLPLPPFADEDCRVVGEDLGMNQLRLAISWSLLEPAPGVFDDDYVARIVALAAACDRAGVHTLVDLHQDGWSKYIAEDGAPFWAHAPPLPPEDIDERNSGHNAASAEAQAAFAGFLADDALIGAYVAMAEHLAPALEHAAGVVGLELMNEPIGAPDALTAFQRRVAKAVRAAAPTLPLFFEPSAVRNVVDFAQPDSLDVDASVYAPHLYTGVFQGNWSVGDDARIEASVAAMLDEAARVEAPLVVTEFGNDPADATGAAWLAAALGALDRHAVSASLWLYEEWPSTCEHPSCWGLYDETASGTGFARTLRPAAVELLARAYPQAIAGALDAFDYDVASRTLTVHVHGAAGTHVLAAPRLVYPADVVVLCDGAEVSAERTGGRVAVRCDGSTLVMRPSG